MNYLSSIDYKKAYGHIFNHFTVQSNIENGVAWCSMYDGKDCITPMASSYQTNGDLNRSYYGVLTLLKVIE